MFTGIVEEVGVVRNVTTRGASARLEIGCRRVLEGTRVGDSIAVNGCCLTVTTQHDGAFAADLMGETLARTALGRTQPGETVNLERSLASDGRFGGHLVQGHVDAVGEVTGVEPRDGWSELSFSLPAEITRYVVPQGSIAVEGVSLTVQRVTSEGFTVGLIPHTLAHTALGRRRVGDPVNLEADVVAKYVRRLLAADEPSPYAVVQTGAATPSSADRDAPRSAERGPSSAERTE